MILKYVQNPCQIRFLQVHKAFSLFQEPVFRYTKTYGYQRFQSRIPQGEKQDNAYHHQQRQVILPTIRYVFSISLHLHLPSGIL